MVYFRFINPQEIGIIAQQFYVAPNSQVLNKEMYFSFPLHLYDSQIHVMKYMCLLKLSTFRRGSFLHHADYFKVFRTLKSSNMLLVSLPHFNTCHETWSLTHILKRFFSHFRQNWLSNSESVLRLQGLALIQKTLVLIRKCSLSDDILIKRMSCYGSSQFKVSDKSAVMSI